MNLKRYHPQRNKTALEHPGTRALVFLCCAAVLLAASPAAQASAAGSQPADIRGQCVFTASTNNGAFGLALDASLNDGWVSAAGPQTIEIGVNAPDASASGFYFRWSTAPTPWKMYAVTDTGERTQIAQGGTHGWLCELAGVPEAYARSKRFVLVSEGPLGISDLSVFAGGIPEYVPRWTATPKRVDMLVLSAHPDDETVFMGPPALMAMNEGRSVVTAYMTWGQDRRRFEANEACWMLGEKYSPDLRASPDMRGTSLQMMQLYWPLDKAVGFIVEEIRKYRPSVIVTHDPNGEYGHGAHMETSYAAAIAFNEAGDPDKYPESAAKYGTWKPGKLYLHLYKQERIQYDPDTALPAYGGQTIRKVVLKAFLRHASQTGNWSPCYDGPLSMRDFGLYATNVGPDTGHTSMFENITNDAMGRLNRRTAPGGSHGHGLQSMAS